MRCLSLLTALLASVVVQSFVPCRPVIGGIDAVSVKAASEGGANVVDGGIDAVSVKAASEGGADFVDDVVDTALKPGRGGISMTIEELAKHVGGTGRAGLMWDLYKLGEDASLFYDATLPMIPEDRERIFQKLPSSRRDSALGQDALLRLKNTYQSGCIEGGVATLVDTRKSSDGTTKLLLLLADGMEVETVIIPWEGIRSTLCISSQCGCRQGCTFCATGKMGKLRDLTADEILSQMYYARKICRLEELPDVTNVVFMGMGEPSDNAEAVKVATEILTKRGLFQLSATKVCVSTVAPSPEAFRKFTNAPCVLAWSVHAADDTLRKQLVPTTKYKMTELRQGLIDALMERPRNLRTAMLEVALISDVNDSLTHADQLAEFSRVITETVPGSKLVVNLIPLNDIGHGTYRKPPRERVDAFEKRLWTHGLYACIRVTRGDDESAACGQLATKKLLANKNDASP